jgi:hypothetical protein
MEKMFQTTNQLGLIPMTSPFSNGFFHGFPMIYGDLWWLPQKPKV